MSKRRIQTKSQSDIETRRKWVELGNRQRYIDSMSETGKESWLKNERESLRKNENECWQHSADKIKSEVKSWIDSRLLDVAKEDLPVSPGDCITKIIRPMLQSSLVGTAMRSAQAEILMTAIALQESNLEERYQNSRDRPGPAFGLWQFEESGGVKGVMQSIATCDCARMAACVFDLPWDSQAIHKALAENDTLAALFARLLLWTDPKALPPLDSPVQCWQYYINLWRPGIPRPKHWDDSLKQAIDAGHAHVCFHSSL